MKAQDMFKKLGYEQNRPLLFSERNFHLISWKLYGITDDYRKTETIKRITFDICKEEWSIFNICTKELGADKYNDITISLKEHQAIHQQMKELGWLDD